MKTTFTYDSYWTYETLKSNIFKLKELFAKLVSVESICTTPEGRNIFALTITSPASDPLKKPAFYVDGGTHAGEVTGTMAAMHTADVTTVISSISQNRTLRLVTSSRKRAISRVP